MNCEATQTIGQITDLLLKNNLNILKTESKPLSKEFYVLKFKGLEEYLLDESISLISIETIRTMLRAKQGIEIVLAERSLLPIKDWERLTDYYELVKPLFELKLGIHFFFSKIRAKSLLKRN